MTWSDYHVSLFALVLWREARGESREGIRAVAHVIRNRVYADHIPDDWDSVITAKWQFSSLTAPGDSQLVLWPKRPDPKFEDCMQIAQLVFDGGDFDLTNGATHYANLDVCDPKWAHTMTKVATIGRHTFFK